MKKTFTILFLFVYVILTVGLNIIIHTCGGESESLLATTTFEDPCGCADGMETETCCSTELTTVKLDDAQKISTIPTLLNLVVSDELLTEVISNNLFQDSGYTNSIIVPASPPPNNDLNISNSVFLI